MTKKIITHFSGHIIDPRIGKDIVRVAINQRNTKRKEISIFPKDYFVNIDLKEGTRFKAKYILSAGGAHYVFEQYACRRFFIEIAYIKNTRAYFEIYDEKLCKGFSSETKKQLIKYGLQKEKIKRGVKFFLIITQKGKESPKIKIKLYHHKPVSIEKIHLVYTKILIKAGLVAEENQLFESVPDSSKQKEKKWLNKKICATIKSIEGHRVKVTLTEKKGYQQEMCFTKNQLLNRGVTKRSLKPGKNFSLSIYTINYNIVRLIFKSISVNKFLKGGENNE